VENGDPSGWDTPLMFVVISFAADISSSGVGLQLRTLPYITLSRNGMRKTRSTALIGAIRRQDQISLFIMRDEAVKRLDSLPERMETAAVGFDRPWFKLKEYSGERC
jgi:hypothetical protein